MKENTPPKDLLVGQSPLDIRVINCEGQICTQGSGQYAWKALQQSFPVQDMLTQVFPDLEQWFDLEALPQVNEQAMAVIMLDEAGIVCGFAHARQESLVNGPEGRDKWVFSILAASQQGMGIGKKLMGELKKGIVEHGGKYLFARTDPARTDTVAFYKSQGFIEDGTVGHYYSYDEGPAPAIWLWCNLQGII